MNPNNLQLISIILYSLCFSFYVLGYFLTFHGGKQDESIIFIVGGILLFASPVLSSIASQKRAFLKSIRKTVTKFEGSSLYILDKFKGSNGLMIALPEMVNNPTVRYLLDLEVLGVEVFPNSDHGYFLTDLGRYLLSNKMGFKLLYPEILCELLKVGFWQSHNGFEREKVTFKRKYNISWDRGVDLLVNALREKK